ncbi:Ribonuclease/ribotoxin [Fimicolochytrium jonesii]|uniref:Ribonuclease/ribotoxin n=1 Tax=Fimicolochytrium jonesii TaxID=1396493 RepID=UPI0022FF37E4|nr:Ribonuclease/ribotoxin [Fimicolochytrium jonesii]KAI8817081.1 Ribonuclease/ribotoxin [Fimicolochytrium jonesii]
MLSSYLALALAASATLISAAPAHIVARDESCGNVSIKTKDINAALTAAHKYQNNPIGLLNDSESNEPFPAPTTDSTSSPTVTLTRRYEPYPHGYDNREGFLTGKCATQSNNGNTYEFPIIRGGVYNGGSPGKYRVVYYPSGGSSVLCAVVYHGGNGNTFKICH